MKNLTLCQGQPGLWGGVDGDGGDGEADGGDGDGGADNSGTGDNGVMWQ